MIAVKGYKDASVAVLGLGRSGRATVAALEAGGATALAWDDSAQARAGAEDDGVTLRDLTKPGAFDGVAQQGTGGQVRDRLAPTIGPQRR